MPTEIEYQVYTHARTSSTRCTQTRLTFQLYNLTNEDAINCMHLRTHAYTHSYRHTCRKKETGGSNSTPETNALPGLLSKQRARPFSLYEHEKNN